MRFPLTLFNFSRVRSLFISLPPPTESLQPSFSFTAELDKKKRNAALRAAEDEVNRLREQEIYEKKGY